MTLLEQCKQFLLNRDEVDWYGDYSDGGYLLKINRDYTSKPNDNDGCFECEFYYTTCYGLPKTNDNVVEFGVDEVSNDHVLVWFHSKRGHGTSHITDIETFKWYVDTMLK